MAAQRRLKRYRQGTLLAVALTGLVLLVSGTTDVPAQDAAQAPGQPAVQQGAPPAIQGSDTAVADPAQSLEEATGTLRRFAVDFTDLFPKILVALALVVAAAVLVRLVRALLRRVLGEWERAEATTAMAGVLIWLLAIGVALSVIAGDPRALVGSVGLLGLALS